MSKGWKAENPDRLQAPCARTAAWEAFPGAAFALAEFWGTAGSHERVRFMRLGPGGELSRHADITDRDAGLRDGQIARLHIPVTTHTDCVFEAWSPRGDRQALRMEPGGLYYLDVRKPHRVRNPTDVERVHLVVDAVVHPFLRQKIATSDACF